MEYKKKKIKELKPNPWNPNEMTNSTMEHLKKEIQRIGFVQPILINQDNIIIDGEHRWKAAMELGSEDIDVIQIEIDAKEAKIATVNMNQIKGEINPVKFGELILDLQKDYSSEAIQELLNMSEIELESLKDLVQLEDFDPEKIDLDPRKKTGTPLTPERVLSIIEDYWNDEHDGVNPAMVDFNNLKNYLKLKLEVEE